jgi:hypothetical protein
MFRYICIVLRRFLEEFLMITFIILMRYIHQDPPSDSGWWHYLWYRYYFNLCDNYTLLSIISKTNTYFYEVSFIDNCSLNIQMYSKTALVNKQDIFIKSNLKFKFVIPIFRELFV